MENDNVVGDANRPFDHEFRFPSCPQEALRIQEIVVELLERLAYNDRQIFGVRLALEEALVNAIKHGNRSNPAKHVRCSFSVSATEVRIEIEDQGVGFCIDDVPDPTIPENLERPNGRGLLLMRHFMTELCFIPPGNICQMRVIRNTNPEADA